MTTAQSWDPRRYAANARFVPELGQPVLELLAPQPGERILDLGCGDGALTEKLSALGCIVTGVDASPEQIAAARARGFDARVVDGERLPFNNEFDAVFSNAALHWMKNADAVIAGVARALKPRGRFVGEMGGAGNIAHIAAALSGGLAKRGLRDELPWYFPTAEEYRAKLERGGFEVTAIALFARPTTLPGDIAAWFETFAGGFWDNWPSLNAGGSWTSCVMSFVRICSSRTVAGSPIMSACAFGQFKGTDRSRARLDVDRGHEPLNEKRRRVLLQAYLVVATCVGKRHLDRVLWCPGDFEVEDDLVTRLSDQLQRISMVKVPSCSPSVTLVTDTFDCAGGLPSNNSVTFADAVGPAGS